MKKNMLGAVVLSAALAVGTTMPAFATGTETADAKNVYTQETTDNSLKYGTGDDWQNLSESSVDYSKSTKLDDGVSGSTDVEGSYTPVYIQTNIAQINVAVPTKLVFVAESTGGAMMTPSANIYKVENFTTKAPIFITAIDAAYAAGNENGAKWALTDDNTAVGAGETSGAARATMLVDMTSEPSANGQQLNAAVITDGADLISTLATGEKGLKIDKATAATETTPVTASKLGFTFNATSSVVNNAQDANKEEVNAFNLIYTIGTSIPKAAATEPTD